MNDHLEETDRRRFLKSSAALAALLGVPAEALSDINLRYACKGELHKDFHASILDGINYMLDNYGEDSIRRILFSTGTKVYRQMHEKLVAGDTSELIEWWRYYMDREGGRYSIDENADGTAVFTVCECPARRHLAKRGIAGGERTCWATRVLNDAICSDSPYEIVTDRTGDSSCRQVLRRRLPDCLVGRISESAKYDSLGKNLKTAFGFLRGADLAALPNGRTEVDGEKVYVNVMTPKLKPFEQGGRAEAHRRYVDIHVPINGRETIGHFKLTDKELELPFNSKDDYVLFEAKTSPMEIGPGEFAAFFPPYGGHMPNRCAGTPAENYRKAVVKVLV